MDPNPGTNARARAQAAESRWFLLFACVVLLAPPLLAVAAGKRPVTATPAAGISDLDRAALPGVAARPDPPAAPHPVAGAPAVSATEG